MEKKPESIFINRELSWLDFDSRVLALAKEKTVPLGERIKFAAIFGSNMDEFFMVRVGSLYDQTLLKNNKTDNVTHMTAAEQIAAITPRVAELQAKCDKYFQHLVSALAQEGYKKVDFAKLAKPQEHFWKTYFQRELLPLLSPQIVDSRHPFPFLNNKDIYYIAQLHSKNEGISYGIVPVSSQFERVLFVKDGETTCFAFVEELIAHYAATIFSASTVQKQCLFRVTRNADITVDEGMMDHDVDFRDVMSELRLLLQTAEDTRADLVRGGYELLRQRPDGTFAEQPHPAGSPCTIALGRGGSYGAFLENSGPQFVWNALYRRTALLGLRFNERCSYGLEDFVFNAAAYRRVGKAVYIPQVVYRHFESAQSTSCAHTAQALLGRIRALEPWMEAEFHAAQRWCGPEELQAVWKDRRAQAVTFLMHQLRDAHAPGVLRRKAWRTLREALTPYPGSLLDTLHDAGHNKKQTMALLLYQMRLQKLYDLLPVREEQL